MKCIVQRDALNEALTQVSSVVATRTPNPVLECVKITAVESGLLLLATDMQLGIRTLIRQAEIQGRGEAVIPAGRLHNVVREWNENEKTVTLEQTELTLEIRGEDSRFRIFGQDPADYPPVAEMAEKPDLQIKAGVLSRMIDRTLYAAAKESTRYAINGVLWEIKGKKLQLVATDGRRLAHMVGAAEAGPGTEASFIMPAKAMQFLARNLGDPEALVEVKYDSHQCILRQGDWMVTTTLVEGSFPKYEDVIPRDNDKKVEVDRDQFLSAVRRAALLTTPDSKGVRFAFGGNKMVLRSRAPEQGEAEITMQVPYNGPSIEIGFNPLFLIDVMKALDAGTVLIELKESNRPGLVRSGSDFLYVIMPVSLA